MCMCVQCVLHIDIRNRSIFILTPASVCVRERELLTRLFSENSKSIRPGYQLRDTSRNPTVRDEAVKYSRDFAFNYPLNLYLSAELNDIPFDPRTNRKSFTLCEEHFFHRDSN